MTDDMSGTRRAAFDTSSARGQTAGAALMIRPAAFGWNVETTTAIGSRRGPRPPTRASQSAALAEFDGRSRRCVARESSIHAIEDRPEPRCPDAVFPNNWVSFHDDGTVVLYPMLAPTRRRERRPELLQNLVLDGSYSVTRLLDLTHHELGGRFLEGTGSVVFDHVARVAYACLSPRTHPQCLRSWRESLITRPACLPRAAATARRSITPTCCSRSASDSP